MKRRTLSTSIVLIAAMQAGQSSASGILEEVIVTAETAESSFPLPKPRLSAAANVREWSIDPSFAIDPKLSGACVVAPKDGCVLGLVVVDKGQAVVAFPPPTE